MIAIKGHLKRGREVIQLLESLGGINKWNHTGGCVNYAYYIDRCGNIYSFGISGYHGDRKIYTLEEFEKEFPFKIGDKVTIVGIPDFPKTITKMEWDCDEILYSFEGLVNTWFGAKALKKFEMKEERNITLTLDKAKEWYKKGGELKEIALQAFTEEELTKVELPKTWEEFCENHMINDSEAYFDNCSTIHSADITCRHLSYDKNICPSKESAEAHLAMMQLEQLRDCWRQGWEPIWDCSEKWCIHLWGNELGVGVATHIARFLTFLTKEMAEEFLKCFRDLIEKAKDLI